MSQRTALYRHLKGEKFEDTVQNIMSTHGPARYRRRRERLNIPVIGDGRPCSLPMNIEKAKRLASSLHRSKNW